MEETKMKKKLIASVMSMMMIVAMAMPVTASQQMVVTYTEPNDYIISIPAVVMLQVGTETVADTIKATKMNVAPNQAVYVMVTGGLDSQGVLLTRDNSVNTTTSGVSLTSGGLNIVTGTEVARFVDQNLTAEAGGGTLHFEGLDADLRAGLYRGQITFSIGVINTVIS